MGGDGVGDAFAAGQARADELPGVTLVNRRAGGADGLAAVAARGEQHPAGLSPCVVDGGQLAGGQVDSVDAALEPDGVDAAAGGGVLVFGGEEVGPAD